MGDRTAVAAAQQLYEEQHGGHQRENLHHRHAYDNEHEKQYDEDCRADQGFGETRDDAQRPDGGIKKKYPQRRTRTLHRSVDEHRFPSRAINSDREQRGDELTGVAWQGRAAAHNNSCDAELLCHGLPIRVVHEYYKEHPQEHDYIHSHSAAQIEYDHHHGHRRDATERDHRAPPALRRAQEPRERNLMTTKGYPLGSSQSLPSLHRHHSIPPPCAAGGSGPTGMGLSEDYEYVLEHRSRNELLCLDERGTGFMREQEGRDYTSGPHGVRPKKRSATYSKGEKLPDQKMLATRKVNHAPAPMRYSTAKTTELDHCLNYIDQQKHNQVVHAMHKGAPWGAYLHPFRYCI